MADPVSAIRAARALPRIGSFREVLSNSNDAARDPGVPWLLAPCDLQAIKASGVTFVASLLERVIEEQAAAVRQQSEQIKLLTDQREQARRPWWHRWLKR